MWDEARNDKRKTPFNKQQQQREVFRETGGTEERTHRLHCYGQRVLSFYLNEFPLTVSIIFFLFSFYPANGRSPNQICFLECSCNTWLVQMLFCCLKSFPCSFKVPEKTDAVEHLLRLQQSYLYPQQLDTRQSSLPPAMSPGHFLG